MSYVSIREVTPHAGKENVLKERMKSLSGIMSKHGAKSALYKVVAGEGAGRYDLQNWYSSLEEGGEVISILWRRRSLSKNHANARR